MFIECSVSCEISKVFIFAVENGLNKNKILFKKKKKTYEVEKKSKWHFEDPRQLSESCSPRRLGCLEPISSLKQKAESRSRSRLGREPWNAFRVRDRGPEISKLGKRQF